ncbi:hypothetical protein MAR_031831 [Mya arenaria]|uniref:C2H2-type domain-containing protein n=1 Tax=Mya arenaria TaxID=6604 RepID=A0ABY7F6J7_MYAAR|nr:hypothetical protein MAR_031831 [Mya arenaria]
MIIRATHAENTRASLQHGALKQWIFPGILVTDSFNRTHDHLAKLGLEAKEQEEDKDFIEFEFYPSEEYYSPTKERSASPDPVLEHIFEAASQGDTRGVCDLILNKNAGLGSKLDNARPENKSVPRQRSSSSELKRKSPVECDLPAKKQNTGFVDFTNVVNIRQGKITGVEKVEKELPVKPPTDESKKRSLIDYSVLTKALSKTLESKLSESEDSDVKIVIFCNNRPVQSFSVRSNSKKTGGSDIKSPSSGFNIPHTDDKVPSVDINLSSTGLKQSAANEAGIKSFETLHRAGKRSVKVRNFGPDFCADYSDDEIDKLKIDETVVKQEAVDEVETEEDRLMRESSVDSFEENITEYISTILNQNKECLEKSEYADKGKRALFHKTIELKGEKAINILAETGALQKAEPDCPLGQPNKDGVIEPVYVCDQCGKFYRARKTLREHFFREHSKCKDDEPLYLYISGNKYQCPICFNHFHSGSELVSHTQKHTGGFTKNNLNDLPVLIGPLNKDGTGAIQEPPDIQAILREADKVREIPTTPKQITVSEAKEQSEVDQATVHDDNSDDELHVIAAPLK